MPTKYSAPPALIKFLKPYDREIRELALQLRALLLEEIGPCYEVIYENIWKNSSTTSSARKRARFSAIVDR